MTSLSTPRGSSKNGNGSDDSLDAFDPSLLFDSGDTGGWILQPTWNAAADAGSAAAAPDAVGLDAAATMTFLGAGAGTTTGSTTGGTSAPTGATPAAGATPNWISTLANASIKADMTAAAASGTVTYAGLETVFADVAASLTASKTTLTASELSDLRLIAANLTNGLTTSACLVQLANDVATTNAANATYTGGAATATTLGNIAVGYSATQMTELVDKWFLGTDLPSSKVSMSGAAAFSVTYSAVSNPLFAATGPAMTDINQGYLGDCFLLGSLAEVAKQDPAAITSMITSNGNNTYDVRFYVNGVAEYVTVNNQLADGGTEFNSATDDWASLVEKAYAQLQTGAAVTGNTVVGNTWQAIGDGGCPEYALAEITGATQITDYNGSGSTWSTAVYNAAMAQTGSSSGLATSSVLSTLVSDLGKGYDLVLGSMTNATVSGKTTLVADHAMSIYGYDSATGNLEIRNPWGTVAGQTWDTTFEVSLSTLLSDGDTITVDNVAGTPTLSAPVLAAQTANQVWVAGQVVSLALPAGTFTDPQGQALTYSAKLSSGAALPSWLTFNPTSRTFSGTVPASQAALAIVVTATDTSGLSTSETFTAGLAAAPTLASQTAAQSWMQYTKVSFTLPAGTFKDPQGAALTYAAALSTGAALPSWLSFNASTQTFTGTVPAGQAALSLKVTATDSYGLSTSETFAVATPAPAAPVAAATTLTATWADGAAITYAVPAATFTDPQGFALTYAATLSTGAALPSWLSFNAATDTFSGTVPTTSTGTLALKVTATDTAGLSASETITATFSSVKAPTVTNQTAAQKWIDGAAVSVALPANTFTDPQAQALTYSATQSNGAALPTWLTFNATTKTFTGVAPTSGTGSLSLTVTAKDTSGLSATETFAASYAPAQAPVLSVQTPAQTWTLGSSVSLSLPATTFTDPQGSALTYSAFQVVNTGDQLATGWVRFNAATDTFSGVVPGTEAGSLTLMVKATDAYGLSATDTFTVSFKNTAGKIVASLAPTSTPTLTATPATATLLASV